MSLYQDVFADVRPDGRKYELVNGLTRNEEQIRDMVRSEKPTHWHDVIDCLDAIHRIVNRRDSSYTGAHKSSDKLFIRQTCNRKLHGVWKQNILHLYEQVK